MFDFNAKVKIKPQHSTPIRGFYFYDKAESRQKNGFTTPPPLISVRAPVGEQNMAIEKCCIGRGVATFRYKTNPEFYTYTFFKLKSLMDGIKQFNETGTVFGSINKKDFQEMETLIPTNDELKNFRMR